MATDGDLDGHRDVVVEGHIRYTISSFHGMSNMSKSNRFVGMYGTAKRTLIGSNCSGVFFVVVPLRVRQMTM